MPPGMTVVVTGAAGHVGVTLVRALLAQGRRVRALCRADQRGLAGLDVELVRVDIRRREAVAQAFEGADLVIHAAARISLRSGEDPELNAVNVGGTAAVVDACLATGVARLVHVSSVHALDLENASMIDERLPLAEGRRASPYDRSKAAAEREVLRGVAAGLDAVIVSPAAVLGPFDYKPSQVGRLLLDLRAGELPALTGGSQSWVDVRDVAAGTLAAASHGRCGERYLLAGHRRTVVELVKMAAQVVGVAPPRLVLPLGLLAAIAPAAEFVSRLRGREPTLTPVSVRALRGPLDVRIDRARRELGYAPRPLQETVAETMAWLCEHHRTPHEKPPKNRRTTNDRGVI